jgi:hypothetical protein
MAQAGDARGTTEAQVREYYQPEGIHGDKTAAHVGLEEPGRARVTEFYQPRWGGVHCHAQLGNTCTDTCKISDSADLHVS